jgi:hypothetical protein
MAFWKKRHGVLHSRYPLLGLGFKHVNFFMLHMVELFEGCMHACLEYCCIWTLALDKVSRLMVVIK